MPCPRRWDQSDNVLSSLVVHIRQINLCLAARIIPLVQNSLFEQDKISAICTNLVYYIVSPAVRGRSGYGDTTVRNYDTDFRKSRLGDVEASILGVLQAISEISSASRAWKGVVYEAFIDNRFFSMPHEAAQAWNPIIFSLTGSEKQTFIELINRISATPAGGLFTSRDMEVASRTMNLRRMAYAVFAAPKNHFLSHLPAIQEKLVDVLRGSSSPLVQAEVRYAAGA